MGLQVGHPATPVRRVMTCLELTEATLAEAIERRADAVVAHHPLIFKPMTALNLAQPTAMLVAELVRAEIALVAAHTNLDAAAWSTNTVLAETCGLVPKTPLASRDGDALMRWSFSVRGAEKSAAMQAAHRAGAMRVEAVAITDLSQSSPAERVRLDVTIPASARDALRTAVIETAPTAADTFTGCRLDQPNDAVGLGLVAEPPSPLTAEALARQIKTAMGLDAVRVSGPADKKIRSIVICTGSGGSLIGLAAARADALLTGEINYHHGIEAHQRRLPVIEVGHFESEVIVAGPLARRLADDPRLHEAEVEVFAAQRDLQPFRRI